MIRLTVWVVLNSRLPVIVVGFMGLASYTMYYTTQSNMPKRFVFSLSRMSGKLRPQLDIVSRIESSHDSSCSVPQLWEVSENQVLLHLPYQFSISMFICLKDSLLECGTLGICQGRYC